MTDLLHTPLHATHVAAGAKMVDFGGWHMPLQFTKILAEHASVRGDAGMFDASHMGEADFHGPGAKNVVNRLITNDVGRLVDGRALYTVVCREDGGIVDDCIVYRFAENHYRIVVNAANIAKDFAHFREHLGDDDCELVDRSAETALIAVQGPKARAICASLAGPELLDVAPFALCQTRLADVDVVCARTGYTGEDGFEIFAPADSAPIVWKRLADSGVAPCGLGARDTLRLEARLSLYGQDIDETTNPIEAGLGWVVKLDKGVECVGASALAAIKARGVDRKLVGFRIEGRGIARAGAEFVDADGRVIGRVTSGGVAPTVGGSIGMGYLERAHIDDPSNVRVLQRGKQVAMQLVKGPFYKRPAADA